MKYVYLTQGLARNNIKFFPKTPDYPKHIMAYIESQDKDFTQDWYTSLYNYNDTHLKFFEEHKTLKGVKDVDTNRIYFDFDSDGVNTALEDAKQDTITLIHRLREEYDFTEEPQIYFTGNKGFSVEFEFSDDVEFKPNEFKNIVINIASDLKTFDKRIMDTARIVRVPLTKHQKNSCYKLPLTFDELQGFTCKEIVEFANIQEIKKDEVKNRYLDFKYTNPVDKIISLKNKEVENVRDSEGNYLTDLNVDIDVLDDINFNECPSWLSKEKYVLLQGGFPQGTRNDSLMALCATLRNQGFNKDEALLMLKLAVARQEKRYPSNDPFTTEELETTVLDSVYSSFWNGGTYGVDHPLIRKIRETYNIPLPESMTNDFTIQTKGLVDGYKDYIDNFDKNLIRTGLPIDDKIELTAGIAVSFLGGPGVGKTSITNQILNYNSLQDVQSIYFQMDMPQHQMTERIFQIMTGDDAHVIRENFADKKKAMEYYELFEKNYKNVNFSFRSSLTVDAMRDQVNRVNDKTGTGTKLIFIDYFECIKSSISDENAKSASVSAQLRDLARETNACVIVLTQPPKSSGGAGFPLTSMYQVKGASAIAQNLRAIIGLYRVGFGPQESENRDKYFTFVGLKNTMGPLFQVDCLWDGKKGVGRKICPFEDSELTREINHLRKMRLENKYNLVESSSASGFGQANTKKEF